MAFLAKWKRGCMMIKMGYYRRRKIEIETTEDILE